MGKKSALAAMGGIIDGNLHVLVDSDGDARVVVHTGAGRLLGYYVNEAFSAHIWVVKDDTTEMFSLPVSLTVTGAFVEVGGKEGIEYLTSLVWDSDNSMSAGKVMVVYQPYPDE